ncbi:MAG TPA: hypothetical protein VL916_08865, partial [Ilumatobacteraceae bacterium]|nr:hypothetical protein [Ilumatobacteraceae bacterium]
YEPAAEEFFDDMFGGLGGLGEYEEYPDDDYSYDEYSADDGYSYDTTYGDEIPPVTMPELSNDDSFGDLSGDAESIEAPAWERCYEEQAAADATACFQEYVATGEIDEALIPVELRFPECGYADLSWNGDLYSMSDAGFIAAVEAARPCFLALVDAGTLSQYEVPAEVAHLECFEGRNWYNTFDDPEYDQRYYDCIAAANDA